MAPKLVLFDCDGTLVDSQHMIVATMTEAFTRLGHAPPDTAGVLSIIGLSLPEAVGRLNSNLDAVAVGLVVDAYRDTYQAMQFRLAETAPLYPGAFDALKALAAQDDLLLGVVTGKSRRGLDAILETHGLTGLFAVLCTAADGPSKPHPFMVVDAVAALVGDVSEEAPVKEAIAKAEAAHGTIRVLVNCAGIGGAVKTVGKNGAYPLDHFSRIIKVNLIGSFNCIRLVAERMQTAPPIGEERGVCINTASVAALGTGYSPTAYGVAKAGVLHLSKLAAATSMPATPTTSTHRPA